MSSPPDPHHFTDMIFNQKVKFLPDLSFHFHIEISKIFLRFATREDGTPKGDGIKPEILKGDAASTDETLPQMAVDEAASCVETPSVDQKTSEMLEGDGMMETAD